MQRKHLFILVLLSVCALPHLSGQSVSVTIETIREMRSLNNLLQMQIVESENEQLKTIDQLTVLSQQLTQLKQDNKTLLTALEEQERLAKELEKSLTKSCQAKQIKTGFIVGGVCVVGTVLIAVPATIYIYKTYFEK